MIWFVYKFQFIFKKSINDEFGHFSLLLLVNVVYNFHYIKSILLKKYQRQQNMFKCIAKHYTIWLEFDILWKWQRWNVISFYIMKSNEIQFKFFGSFFNVYLEWRKKGQILNSDTNLCWHFNTGCIGIWIE